MNSERQFRLFSVACLGLAALISVSESSRGAMATVSELPAVVVTQEELLSTSDSSELQADIDAVVEVNQINAGRFKPYELGAIEVYR